MEKIRKVVQSAKRPRSMSLCLALLGAVLVAGTATTAVAGSSGPIRTAEIEPMRFDSDRVPIDAAVELCLPPVLRTRQWDVEDYPFRVDLGTRASQNFERLVKSAFREVKVTLDASCGSTTDLPWITAKIVSANRETPSEVTGEFQYSATKILATLHGKDDDPIWEYTADAVVGRRPAWGNSRIAKWFATADLAFESRTKVYHLTLLPPTLYLHSLRHRDAAQSFAEAMEFALDEIWGELISSDIVRSTLEEAQDEINE